MRVTTLLGLYQQQDFLLLKCSSKQLKVEYASLKESWDNEVCKCEMLVVDKPKNKPEYCDAIIKAREILIMKVQNWKEDTEARICHEIEVQDDGARNGIAARMAVMKAHPFHHLHMESLNLATI